MILSYPFFDPSEARDTATNAMTRRDGSSLRPQMWRVTHTTRHDHRRAAPGPRVNATPHAPRQNADKSREAGSSSRSGSSTSAAPGARQSSQQVKHEVKGPKAHKGEPELKGIEEKVGR